jgi:hypothetical protein
VTGLLLAQELLVLLLWAQCLRLAPLQALQVVPLLLQYFQYQ